MFSGPVRAQMPAIPGEHNRPEELWAWSAQDFDVAFRKGLWNRILSKVTRRLNKLPTLSDLTCGCRIHHQSQLGTRIVAVKEIVGSVGRVEDFDREFMPLRSHIKQRWISIDRAYYVGASLPPIKLIRVNEQYVVSDGHHRISVARAHGQAYIEADVTQSEVRCGEHLPQPEPEGHTSWTTKDAKKDSPGYAFHDES